MNWDGQLNMILPLAQRDLMEAYRESRPKPHRDTSGLLPELIFAARVRPSESSFQHVCGEHAEVPDRTRIATHSYLRAVSKLQALRRALEGHALCLTVNIGSITLNGADRHDR